MPVRQRQSRNADGALLRHGRGHRSNGWVDHLEQKSRQICDDDERGMIRFRVQILTGGNLTYFYAIVHR